MTDPDKDFQEIQYRVSAVTEILPLRHRVLRPGVAMEVAEFPGDMDDSTLHFAALQDDKVLSCLSVYASKWQDEDAFQLRGMATDASHQRCGIGGKLLQYAVSHVPSVKYIWCNARVEAIGFYRKFGWNVKSDEFDIEGVGPHVRMCCSLEKGPV